MSVTTESMANCLVCESSIEIDATAEKGEILECRTCGQEHELTGSTDGGFEISLAPEVEEDWGE